MISLSDQRNISWCNNLWYLTFKPAIHHFLSSYDRLSYLYDLISEAHNVISFQVIAVCFICTQKFVVGLNKVAPLNLKLSFFWIDSGNYFEAQNNFILWISSKHKVVLIRNTISVLFKHFNININIIIINIAVKLYNCKKRFQQKVP